MLIFLGQSFNKNWISLVAKINRTQKSFTLNIDYVRTNFKRNKIGFVAIHPTDDVSFLY